jgi:hypothetical protein
MEYDQIVHDTSALDNAMKVARDRDRMGAQSVLNRSRAALLGSSIPLALIAGVAFVGAASAAAWIMRPHFDFQTVVIDVPKLVERDVEVPKLVERPVEVPRAAPGPLSDATPLPPKTPHRAESRFIDRPDYQSADFKGRIVRSDENELKFEDGKKLYPALMNSAGEPVRDDSGGVETDVEHRYETDRFIGDYAYCNKTVRHPDLWDCFVNHNGVVQSIPSATYDGRKV